MIIKWVIIKAEIHNVYLMKFRMLNTEKTRMITDDYVTNL